MAKRVRVLGHLYHGHVPAGAVYAGRPAPGLRGSPYASQPAPDRVCRLCGVTHDRDDALAAYERDLDDNPALVAAARRELADVEIACWCRPEVACHVDVLFPTARRMRRAQSSAFRSGRSSRP